MLDIRSVKILLNDLPETNSSHLKMDGWNTSFLLWKGLYSGAMLVSGSVTNRKLFTAPIFGVCALFQTWTPVAARALA